jgi:superfamily I DNA and/or RNA helicase
MNAGSRFNVAITRSKALLIVIGNPHILGQVIKFFLECKLKQTNNIQYSGVLDFS